jgi:pimeloyl-ACP methyl ester carboxylesterase
VEVDTETRLTVGALYTATVAALAAGSYAFAFLDEAVSGFEERSPALADVAVSYFGSEEELAALLAISCADDPARPPLEDVLALQPEIERGQPLLGPWAVAACLEGWPPTAEARPDLRPSPAPIVVVGTQYDPITPYRWSVALAEALGSAALVSYEVDTHTAVWGDSWCIDDIVVAYFVYLEMPPAGARCPVE